MVIWISKRLALAIHDRQLAEHGGSIGVRDETLLDTAIARPQQLFAYGDPPPDLAALSASLAYGLARNHPFTDGNKRTAWVLARLFLALNDVRISFEPETAIEMVLLLASGKLTEDEVAAWLTARRA